MKTKLILTITTICAVIAWVAIGKPATNETVAQNSLPASHSLSGKDLIVNLSADTNAVEKWTVLAGTNLYVSVVPQATNAGTVTYQLLSSSTVPAKTYTEAEVNAMLDKTYRMGFARGVWADKRVELDESASNHVQRAWDVSQQTK